MVVLSTPIVQVSMTPQGSGHWSTRFIMYHSSAWILDRPFHTLNTIFQQALYPRMNHTSGLKYNSLYRIAISSSAMDLKPQSNTSKDILGNIRKNKCWLESSSSSSFIPLFLQNRFQLLQGDSPVFPSQQEDIILPACLGSASWPSPSGPCPV